MTPPDPAGYRPPRTEQVGTRAVREELGAGPRLGQRRGGRAAGSSPGPAWSVPRRSGRQLVTSRVSYRRHASTDGPSRLIAGVPARRRRRAAHPASPNSSVSAWTYLNSGAPPGSCWATRRPDRAAEQWRLGDQRQSLLTALRRAVVDRRAGLRAGRLVDPGISRSHFQAQQWLEKGGSGTASSGWLDRTLAAGARARRSARWPRERRRRPSLAGDAAEPRDDQRSAASPFRAAPRCGDVGAGPRGPVPRHRRAARRGRPGDPGALGTAATIARPARSGVTYPSGDFGDALSTSPHPQGRCRHAGRHRRRRRLGHPHRRGARPRRNLASGAAAAARVHGPTSARLAAAGSPSSVMTEFGRRVAMNDSGGTDHGHGSVMWLLGGGLKGSGVYGKWTPLTARLAGQRRRARRQQPLRRPGRTGAEAAERGPHCRRSSTATPRTTRSGFATTTDRYSGGPHLAFSLHLA